MESVCKFYKQEKFVSYDEGQTWSSLGEYQKGELYETDSVDCMSKQYRVVPLDGNYMCVGKDKYLKGIRQYTIDGLNWYNDYPTTYVTVGNPVEVDSPFCDNKFVGHYGPDITEEYCKTEYGPNYHLINGVCTYLPNPDPIKIVKCNDSPILTKAEVDFMYELYEAYVGDCVTTIGENAFSARTSMFSIELPNTIERIEHDAFNGCTLLKEIDIPMSTTYIGNNAFSNCTNLRIVEVPSAATLGNSAFTFCTSLGYSMIPSAPDRIHVGCTSLSSVTFNNTFTEIGFGAFSGCTSLGHINIPSTVTSIRWNAFMRCTALNSIDIPNSVTYIGSQAFWGCQNLQTATLPSGLTSINGYVFAYCTKLSNVTIPSGVTYIGDNAFIRCSGMTRVDIPSGVTKIGRSAFKDCKNLTSITCRATTPPWLNEEHSPADYEDTFSGSSCPIYVPCEAINDYAKSDSYYDQSDQNDYIHWGNYIYRLFPIESSCNFDYSFRVVYDDGYTHKVPIPSWWRYIGSGLLDYDKKTKDDVVTVNLNYGVPTFGTSRLTWMGVEGFNDCKNLRSLNIESGCTSISDRAFSGCTSLNSLVIPSQVQHIGSDAFASCDLLTVSLPNTPIEIGYTYYYPHGAGAFGSNKHLTNIEFPNLCSYNGYSTPTSGTCTFNMNTVYGCTSLTAMTIGGAVEKITFDSTSGNIPLKSLTITCSTPPTMEYYTYDYFPNMVIYVPSEYYDAYMNSGWSSTLKQKIQVIS